MKLLKKPKTSEDCAVSSFEDKMTPMRRFALWIVTIQVYFNKSFHWKNYFGFTGVSATCLRLLSGRGYVTEDNLNFVRNLVSP
jgi:hypothetical protein